MIAIAQITDTRAACAVGTVKKRIRMCGSAGGAEHQRHAQRDLVDRRLEEQPRLEEALAEFRAASCPSRRRRASAATRACTLGSADDVGEEVAEEAVLAPRP